MALRSGVDLRTVQRNMGHSDSRTALYLDPEQYPLDSLPY